MAESSYNLPEQPKVLNSWKEIASYVGRGVRTVQRWEQFLGFPVRRPHGRSRSSVLAFPGEIDEWLRKAPMGTLSGEGEMLSAPANGGRPRVQARTSGRDGQQRCAHTAKLAHTMHARTLVLNARAADLMRELQRAMHIMERSRGAVTAPPLR